MKLLLKTTDETEAKKFEAAMQKKYNPMAIWRFQYRSNDGYFYYEILLDPIWL